MRSGSPSASVPIVVRGVRFGHATSEDANRTGVTVATFDRIAPTVVDVRGGASCTYDIASLDLSATFGRRWAIFFSGGSVHGLDAARGIRTFLLNEGKGHRTFRNPNRIVQLSGAALFDLPRASGPITDYLPLGFEAARSASASRIRIGRFGAGAAARVGKYLGPERAMPGGVGYAAAHSGPSGSVGALVVLNSVGAVRDGRTGQWIAGARSSGGHVIPPGRSYGSRSRPGAGSSQGTNLVLVVTDVTIDRRGLQRVAVQAHDGLARAVVPAHTATDGDVVFVSGTGPERPPAGEVYPGSAADRLGELAAKLVARAAVRAVRPEREG